MSVDGEDNESPAGSNIVVPRPRHGLDEHQPKGRNAIVGEGRDATQTRPDSFISFREVGDTGKTKRWNVEATTGGDLLGVVRWHGAWRCYAFVPGICTIYETKCLTDIATFIDARTQEQKKHAR